MRPGSSCAARRRRSGDDENQGQLAPEERRALLYGPLYRVVGTPVVALLGLANTAIIVRETGEAVFGLVSLVATITLLFPFADLGIGATVISASAMLVGNTRTAAPRRHSSRLPRLFGVAGVLMGVALCIMALDGWSSFVGLPAARRIAGRSPSRHASSHSRFRPGSGPASSSVSTATRWRRWY